MLLSVRCCLALSLISSNSLKRLSGCIFSPVNAEREVAGGTSFRSPVNTRQRGAARANYKYKCDEFTCRRARLMASALSCFLGVVEMQEDEEGLLVLEQRCWKDEMQHQSERLRPVRKTQS